MQLRWLFNLRTSQLIIRSRAAKFAYNIDNKIPFKMPQIGVFYLFSYSRNLGLIINAHKLYEYEEVILLSIYFTKCTKQGICYNVRRTLDEANNDLNIILYYYLREKKLLY